MSGQLDKMAALTQTTIDGVLVDIPYVVLRADDVLLLVEIARAAQVISPKLIEGSYSQNVVVTKAEIDALAHALARLDATATEPER